MGSAGNVTKSKEIFLTKMARGSGGTERSTSWLCLLGQLLAVAFITSLSFPSSGQELVYSQGLSQEISFKMDLSGGSVGKESASNAGDTGDPGSFPGSGRSPGEGNGYPLQYSCLGDPRPQKISLTWGRKQILRSRKQSLKQEGPKRATQRYVTIKMEKVKERILKARREKQSHLQNPP